MIKVSKILTAIAIVMIGSITLIATGGVTSIKQYITASNNLATMNSAVDTLSTENEIARQKLISSNKLNTVETLNNFLQKNQNMSLISVSAYTMVNGELELVAELDSLTDVASLDNIDTVGVTVSWKSTFEELIKYLTSSKITFMEIRVNSIKHEVYLNLPI